MVALVLAYISVPLLSSQPDGSPGYAVEDSLEGLNGDNGTLNREQVFTALSELEFDYRMGKLDGDDYDLMKAELMQTAIPFVDQEAVGQSDAANDQGIGDIDRQIEADIARLQAASSVPPVPEAQYCPFCGVNLVVDRQAFCHRCGRDLAPLLGGRK